jgi:hypothetical protein
MDFKYKIIFLILIFILIIGIVKTSIAWLKIFFIVSIAGIVISFFKSKKEKYYVTEKTYVDNSEIEGVGTFLKKDCNKNETLLHDLFSNDSYKYVNHSYKPNTTLVQREKNIYDLISLRKISADEELVSNYDIDSKKFPFIMGAGENYK